MHSYNAEASSVVRISSNWDPSSKRYYHNFLNSEYCAQRSKSFVFSQIIIESDFMYSLTCTWFLLPSSYEIGGQDWTWVILINWYLEYELITIGGSDDIRKTRDEWYLVQRAHKQWHLSLLPKYKKGANHHTWYTLHKNAPNK